MRVAIEETLGEVPFESPVSVTYCTAVRDALRERLPVGAVLDVCHRKGVELYVEARLEKRRCRVTIPLV